MTRRPRWLASDTGLPSASGSVNSGAGSPGARRTGAVDKPLSVSVTPVILPRPADHGAEGGTRGPCRWKDPVLLTSRRLGRASGRGRGGVGQEVLSAGEEGEPD